HHDVGRQPEIDNIENVEKLSAKLEDGEFPISPVPEGRVLDQGNVELMKAGSAKSVAAQGTESAGIRAGASRHVDRDVEKRAIVRASSKIVFALGTAGGKIGHGQKIGAVRSTGASASLLNSGVDRERWPAGQRSNIEELPAPSHILSHGFQEAHAIKRQQLDQAQRKHMLHIEGRGSFFCPSIPGILWGVERNDPGRRSSEHDTRVIEGL